jgi:cytochrome oxidase assembly protein ShyY1
MQCMDPLEPRFMTPDHELHKQPMQMFWVDQAALENVANIPEGKGTLLTELQTTEIDHIHWPVKPGVETVGEVKTTPAVHAGYAITWFGLSGAGIIMTRKLLTKGRG